jgi:predicted nucleotidyltransferase
MRDHIDMTKVDERAIVPCLDATAKQRLAAALDREGVAAASLIGSQARGEAGPLSDIDVGVWLQPSLPADDRPELRLELAGAAVRALGTGEIDVVVLNGAPALLRHRAMRDGERILERDRAARVRLETRALLEYLDTAPLRATLAEGRRRRLAEGRFGRR